MSLQKKVMMLSIGRSTEKGWPFFRINMLGRNINCIIRISSDYPSAFWFLNPLLLSSCQLSTFSPTLTVSAIQLANFLSC